MVVLHLKSPLIGAAIAASVHGAVDVCLPPQRLVPYLLIFAPLQTHVTTLLFGVASLVHFSRDSTFRTSLLLHACFLTYDLELASGIFCLYYVLVHSPLSLARRRDHSSSTVAAFVLFFALLALTHEVREVFVDDVLQKMVISHVIVDEVERRR